MVNELEIRQYNRHNNTVLWKLLKNKIVEECQCKLVIATEEKSIDLIVDVKKTEDKITIKDTVYKRNIVIFHKDDEIYLSNNVIVTSDEKQLYYLLFSENEVPFDLSTYNIVKDRYFYECCGVSGSLNDLKLNEDKISLMVFDEELWIFLDYGDILSLNLAQLAVCLQRDDGSTVIQFTNQHNMKSYFTFTKLLEELETKIEKAWNDREDSGNQKI